jgi:hypothetical protein
LAGKEPTAVYTLVKLTPLTVKLVRFQELMYAPRLLDCQQKAPIPSWVKGAAIVAVTGLHVEPLVGVAVIASEVGVRVGVFGTKGVTVRVNVGPGVAVRVEVLVTKGVTVRVGVSPAVGVLVAVDVDAQQTGSAPAARIPRM